MSPSDHLRKDLSPRAAEKSTFYFRLSSDIASIVMYMQVKDRERKQRNCAGRPTCHLIGFWETRDSA